MNPSPTESSAPLPKVTVVTIVLNGVDVVERTLRSVIGQDYPNLEYVVVDGCSTDGTIDVIRRNEGSITRWVSATDNGAYAAMNRGASLATGEWIAFMNGGDLFASSDAISRVFAACDPATCDVVYGHGIITGNGFRVVQRGIDPNTFSDGNGFSHQSAFVRTSLQRRYGFDVGEPIAADYDLFLRLYKDRKVFRPVDVVVSEFFLGGLSSVSDNESIRLRHRVYRKHLRRSDAVLYYRLGVLAAKRAGKALVPRRLWVLLKRVRNRDKILSLDH